MTQFKPGDEVVVFNGNHPCQHNSQHSPKHPCRGKVLKIGRLLFHVQSTGAPLKIRMDGTGCFKAYSVEEAKIRHRANFPAGDWRSAAMIDRIVMEL